MTDPVGPKNADYERGREEGEIAATIAARLLGHDKHFEAINGSVAKVATELHTLNLAVQRLADQAVARDAQTTKAFDTFRELDETRRSLAGESWSLWRRVAAYLVAAFMVTGTMVLLWILGQR